MNDIPFPSVTSKWRLDERYGFQFAFFCENLPPSSEKDFISVSPFKEPANEPDIKNIFLFSFLNRGFLPKVKAQSEDQKFYLKLFKFPKEILPEKSYKKKLDKFLLTNIQGQELQCYIAGAENIFIKFGWIGLKSIDFVSRPFPRFLIPNNSIKAQEYFDSSLPFSSLYLLPAGEANPELSEEQLIEHSYGGVVSFREELLKIYSSTCDPIETINQNNMFIVDRQCYNETTTMVRKISVITLKQIDDFKKPHENFKDFKKRLIERPMPLSEHDFLSSLLLVDYTDYIPDKKDVLKVPSTKEQLDLEWRPDLDSNHVLEIASIVRLENIKVENGSHSLAAKYIKVPNTLDTRGEDYKLPSFTNADQTALAGKRVLMISADGPELPEIDVPMEYLKARGADVKLAGQNWIFEYRDPPGHIVIAQWLADNICVKADLALKDVRVAEWDDKAKKFKTNYDAIFIPGGAWNPDMLRTDGDALRIVREARAHGVLIVSLCHGPQVLISAARSDPSGQVVFPRGTLITGVQSIRADLDNAGFTVLDKEPTVYDPISRLLTARNPDDLKQLCENMERLLS